MSSFMGFEPRRNEKSYVITNLHCAFALFGGAYVKIGTIQRRLAWPLHKDDTCSQNGFTYG
ncbi:hypothetical protein PGT21_014808 [Puccinia graminis f. sp. tritici]|uniref:Uncharacterized protein n=1 Tax=Puccinia graminis f. sp. tritici TaxID=56615 RepID=A0A5B0LKF0_PUCGR|nr:hypothetical protein PGTUg99_005256 [Puccinia graminis f. sp. tritici]KAA1092815.1 hypothetical protein PGT21_014808 [Puccinia graminis f. sp. tritici]